MRVQARPSARQLAQRAQIRIQARQRVRSATRKQLKTAQKLQHLALPEQLPTLLAERRVVRRPTARLLLLLLLLLQQLRIGAHLVVRCGRFGPIRVDQVGHEHILAD